jgi:adenylate cyclase class 2
MPVEIEAKLKVDSHAAVRARLAAAGGQCVGRVLEENHIFDNPDRTMLAADCGLRVRVCRDHAGQVVSTTVTYKGPPCDGRYKSRPEIQFHADDGPAAIAFLNALGFVEAVCFEKRRESWKLDDCRVELDEVPHLGPFVEIEGPSEAAVAAAQQTISLEHLPHEPGSYIALLVEHCRRHHLPTTAITFESTGSL